MKAKENFEDMLNTINRIKDITNLNDAQFKMNLYYDQSDEIGDDLMLKILF